MSYTETLAETTDTFEVGLFYPRCNPCQFIEVSLMDLRAADDVRLSFDFERNGWKIEQPTKWAEGESADRGWTEVAFVPAWHPSLKQ